VRRDVVLEAEGAVLPDTHSLVLIKDFEYRDVLEEWSNRYHLSVSGTVTDNDWKGIADAFVAAERPCLPVAVRFVRAYGYFPGVDHADWSYDYVQPGPPPTGILTAPAGGVRTPGDVAATIRWYTGKLNSRGKKVYCRKYFHGVYANSSDADFLEGTQAAAFTTYAGLVTSGTFPLGAEYCAPQGEVLRDPLVDPYLTTRTLKRRGKRPLPLGTSTRAATSGAPESPSLGVQSSSASQSPTSIAPHVQAGNPTPSLPVPPQSGTSTG
jgi:hypothetical protein